MVNSGQSSASNFFFAVPLIVAPSQYSRRRKRHARVSDLSAKRRRTISSPSGRTLDSSHQGFPESRGDATNGSAEPEGRAEGRLASLEIRDLQDDHSSGDYHWSRIDFWRILFTDKTRALQVPTEANQPHTQCIYSAFGDDGLASSNLGSFTTPHNHVTPTHASQTALQHDGTVPSQQILTVAPLGLPVCSSQNPSFSNSSVQSEPAEQASVVALQPRNDGMQQNISVGASLNHQAVEAEQIPSAQRNLNEGYYSEFQQSLRDNEPNTSNISIDEVHPNTVLNRPYIPGSCDFAEELHAPIQYSYQPGMLDINTEDLYPPYEPGDLLTWIHGFNSQWLILHLV